MQHLNLKSFKRVCKKRTNMGLNLNIFYFVLINIEINIGFSDELSIRNTR